jgi:hypothetical protein
VATVLLAAGCTASEETAAPSTSLTPAPTPTVAAAAPTYAPLVVPPVADDELARVVFTNVGPDGVPTSEGAINAAPLPDQSYALEGACVPEGAVVQVSYRVQSTDGADVELQSGTFACDGTGIMNVGAIDSPSPPQVMFTVTDGAAEAYLRLIPYEG